MEQNNEKQINVTLKSDSYQEKETNPIQLQMNVNLCKAQNTEDEQESTAFDNQSKDTLFIKFKSQGPLPDNVATYIEDNLGEFELVDNETEKILIFELKIKDIDFAGIQKIYSDFFEKNLDSFFVTLSVQKNQDLNQMYEQMSQQYRVPFFFHALESSYVNLESKNAQQITKSLADYFKTLNINVFDTLHSVMDTFQNLQGDVQLKEISKHNEEALKKHDLDHRGLYQEICLSFNNPLNRYIFNEKVEDQELEISGKILGIINYEIKAKFGDLKGFFEKIKDLN